MSRCEVALAVGLIVVQSLTVELFLLVAQCFVDASLPVDARSTGMGCGEGLEEERQWFCFADDRA